MVHQQKMRALTDEERADLHSVFFDRLVRIAKGICQHFPPTLKDEKGHDKHPCPHCVRAVREVTFAWHVILREQAVLCATRAQELQTLPYLGLHHAYEAVSAQMEPDRAKATEKFGPL